MSGGYCNVCLHYFETKRCLEAQHYLKYCILQRECILRNFVVKIDDILSFDLQVITEMTSYNFTYC